MAEYTMSNAIKKKIPIPPIAYDYDGVSNLTIKKDIPYCVVNGIEQSFDIYYPKNFVKYQSKVILFVNGGGPIDKNYKAYPCFTSWGELAAINHMVAITFNWRSGKSQDIFAMLEYIKSNTDKLGFTLDQLTVFSLCRAVNYTINCVLEYPEIKKMVMYYGKVSINTNVKKCKGMKFFIALGNKDKRFSPECNNWFIEQSKENGYQVELLVHPQGVHGFDYANRDIYTKEIIDKTIDFCKQPLS